MTSGEFHPVPTTQISVKEGRHRKDPRIDIDILANSIDRLGLIHPIVVTRAHELVAGERRLIACRDVLGWTHISAQYVDELSERELKKIELEENIKRRNIEWAEECLAAHELHELYKSDDPSWTQEKTAEAIGLVPMSVSKRLAVANELLKGNVEVAAAPKFSTAFGIVERRRERERAKEDEAFQQVLTPAAVASAESILTADFLEWAPAYSGPRFNLIHCDFPYGIGASKFNQGSAPLHGGYDDSPEAYWSLVECLHTNMERLVADSSHLVFWFSMEYYTETLERLRRDWEVSAFPLIWHKTDNSGILPDPSRGPRRIYETAFLGVRGDRKVVRAVSNAYGAPSDKTVHMSIMPEPMLRHFFGMLVDEHTRLLDPTCGSGSAVRAAESLGAVHALGLERNPEFAEDARLLLRQARARGGFKYKLAANA